VPRPDRSRGTASQRQEEQQPRGRPTISRSSLPPFPFPCRELGDFLTTQSFPRLRAQEPRGLGTFPGCDGPEEPSLRPALGWHQPLHIEVVSSANPLFPVELNWNVVAGIE